MTDEQTTAETGSSQEQAKQEQSAAHEAWAEVGQHFQALGESLARVFRAAWQNEANRQHLQDLRTSLETTVDRVGEAVKEVTSSPEAQQVRGEAEKIAQSARSAGEQTLHEMRPHLLSALHQLRSEVEKLINRLEEEGPVAEAGASTGATVEVLADSEGDGPKVM